MHTNTLEETELTDNTNEQNQQPEQPETTTSPELEEAKPEPQEQEVTALVPAEPEVIEGEVIELEQPDLSEDHTPPKQKPYWLLIPFTILFCLVFVASSFLFPLLTPSATITIIPVERNITLTAAIKVHGRQLPALTLMQSTSIAATGKRHQNATRAVGTITLYNGLLFSQTIAAGTLLTGSDGVQVVTDQAARIPAANPPIEGQVTISAHALITGTQKNIPAYDINTACCATSVVAKNTGAFTGGAAARDFLIVTRADINNAVTSLLITLSQSEDAALQVQLHRDEDLITPSCNPSVSSDHKPGDEAKHVSVTVSVTCSGISYDTHNVYANATQLISQELIQRFGTGLSPLGNIQVSVLHATITDHTKGLATLSLKIDATYLYQIREGVKEHLSTLLAGKPIQQAINILLQFPGIQAASVHLAGSNTTLPTDPRRIQITVMYRGS